MKNIINLFFVLFPILVLGQTTTENYFKTVTYKVPTTVKIVSPTTSQAVQNTTYFNGLGRPMQKIAGQQSASGKDIIIPIEYDGFGRQANDYLPFKAESTNMAFDPNAKINVLNYYSNPNPATNGNPALEATNTPYSQKALEASPLNRILQQAAPGNPWSLTNNQTIKFDYQANLTADLVRTYSVTTLLDANGVYAPTLSSSANYPAGELYKNITKDENWISGSNNTTEEFKDKEGHVILKRTYNENLPHDTYYIYDIYGNLTYVLPPKAEGSITGSVLNDLCYQYKYDYRNRLVEKKLPGKGWEYIVYDKLDRPVLTQDANLKSQNKWLFTKYDAFGRPVYTGEYTNAGSRADLQNTVTSHSVLFETKSTSNSINGSIVYYTNNAFPNVNNADINLFTINYYDDYGFDINGGNAESSGGITPITNAKGLATGTKVRILGSSAWTTNVIYYDPKGRVIYNYSKNDFLGVTQKLKSELDFVGLPIQTTTQHIKGSTNITIVDAFSYDHAGRLKKQTQTINGSSPEVIAENSYDELGQLVTKAVGGKGASRLQSVDYTYNIRGWLKGINDSDNANNAITMGTGDLFGFQINYSNPSSGTPLYNGNISQTFWKTQTQDTGLKNYTYSYDALNRLTNAVSQDAGRYNESLSYDKNGNILNLTRKGYTDASATDLGIMDNLAYTYDAGNKLFKVKDSSGSTEGFKDGIDTVQEYTYDANGNMKTDGNKGITAISYNHLNLPVDVTLPGGTIHYDYDASGVKQRKVVSGITTDYANGFQYEKLGSGNFVLKFFPTAEGYVNHNNGIFEYIYQYKDHLGNVRLSYKDVSATPTPSLQIVETNHYYPFGLKQKIVGELNNQSGYKYKYNGKELQDELGLNMYDMEARNYMPDLGRWGNIDELSESFFEYSPYNFALNNPLIFSDPTGLSPEGADHIASTFIRNGKVVEHRDDGDSNVYQVGDDWKPGGSKQGLKVIGQEVPGADYRVGYRVNIINGNALPWNPNHTIQPIGGAFDIFGVWETFWTQLFSEMGDDSPTMSLAAVVVSKGKVKPATSVRVLTGLLKAGKLHKHHVLSQQFRKWFASRGIKNIDDYAIQMSAKNHLKTLHGQGKWNQQWADFIKANPNASPNQIFHQAETMLKKYGLEHSRYVPYK